MARLQPTRWLVPSRTTPGPGTRTGRPTANNLVLFCDHHHDVVHRPGWTMTFNGKDLHIYRPDGTEVLADQQGPDP